MQHQGDADAGAHQGASALVLHDRVPRVFGVLRPEPQPRHPAVGDVRSISGYGEPGHPMAGFILLDIHWGGFMSLSLSSSCHRLSPPRFTAADSSRHLGGDGYGNQHGGSV